MTVRWIDDVRARAERDRPPATAPGPPGSPGSAGDVTRVVLRCPDGLGPARDVAGVLARPAESVAPAVVLLHGGGGRAEPRWARDWAARGHVALALDLGAARAAGGARRPARLDHDDIFAAVAEHSWLAQATEAAADAVSLLRALPGVDPRAVGVCGVSWGGYLAFLLAAADPRLRYAVGVYAAGQLARDGAWSALLGDLPAAVSHRWTDAFDLAGHAPSIAAPSLWLTGTTDPCFPLDAFDATSALPAGPVTRRIVPGLEHGHEPAWRLAEPFAFASSVLGRGPALPAVGAACVTAGGVRAELGPAAPVLAAELHHTGDTGAWTSRRWQRRTAMIDGTTVRADVPAGGFSAAFLSVQGPAGTSTTGLLTGCDAGTGRGTKGEPLCSVAGNRTW
ncbi:dienelactone hydrolase family protein [Jiangella alba]|uniref:Cephalosporin-C deacetylase n=1 Tax=Jiangella alba TaxID=561176 RepID=A0A1H5PZ13_9ACTN|nr:dienelactone hydrolase family protein [Jiangella alba]SEF18939.1 Cephalosporin-C deacetylase [Jiangella alba]